MTRYIDGRARPTGTRSPIKNILISNYPPLTISIAAEVVEQHDRTSGLRIEEYFHKIIIINVVPRLAHARQEIRRYVRRPSRRPGLEEDPSGPFHLCWWRLMLPDALSSRCMHAKVERGQPAVFAASHTHTHTHTTPFAYPYSVQLSLPWTVRSTSAMTSSET